MSPGVKARAGRPRRHTSPQSTRRPSPLSPRWHSSGLWSKITQNRGKTLSKPFERVAEMTKNVSVVIYVAVLIAVIVGVDVLFFRHRLLERLMANVGIVLVFGAFYLRFLGRE